MPQDDNYNASPHDIAHQQIPRAALPADDQRGQVVSQKIPSSDSPQYVQTHAPDVRTLLSWVAPNRPFHKRGKEYYINVLIILIAIEVILFLFHQYMLMALALSVVFLSFTLALIPPHPFHYKISTQGITVEDHYFLWQELYDFYFRRQDGTDMLIISTKAYMPGELTVVLGPMHREHVKEILLPFLPFREFVKPSFIEHAGDWMAKTFPLEKNSKPAQS